MSEAKQTAKLALEALEDKKAMDVRILDITHVSTLADYFMIASGSNRNQVQAMADNVEEVLGKAGVHPKQIEGYQTANWILMDYGDVVIHIFDEENRLFYDLERIWRDGKVVEKKRLCKLGGKRRRKSGTVQRKADGVLCAFLVFGTHMIKKKGEYHTMKK